MGINILPVIRRNRAKKLSGTALALPTGFAPLDKRIYGLIPGRFYIFTAAPHVGKTQLTKFSTMYSPIAHLHKLDQLSRFKIIYFAMEETKEDFKVSFMSHFLHRYYDINLPYTELLSYSKTLSKSNLDLVQEKEKAISELYSPVEVIDDVDTVDGIIKALDERVIAYKDYDFVHVVIDHVSELHYTGMTGLMDSIQSLSRYCKQKVCKENNWTTCFVQQQSSYTESAEYAKAKKLEPSLHGLADNKKTGRIADVVVGLFSPHRHKIERFNKMDITKWKDSYRYVTVIKNRLGPTNLGTHAYFDGAYNMFHNNFPKE